MSYRDIIDRVRYHPEVWQTTHPLFKNQLVRLKFWKQLAEDLQSTEAQLKKSWKYLMDQYRKEYKKTKALEKIVGETVVCGWEYYNALSFLEPTVAATVTKTNDRSTAIVLVNSDSKNAEDATMQDIQENNNTKPQTQVRPLKVVPLAQQNPCSGNNITKADLILRKLQNISTTLTTLSESHQDVLKNDEDHMYFMSILPMVRTLTPTKKLQFRSKINDWLLGAISDTADHLYNNESQDAMDNSDNSDIDDNKDDVRQQIAANENDESD